MLLRAPRTEPPAERRRPATPAAPPARQPASRRVRAVAAPPPLDAATGAARFGPGGRVHLDDGIIARYASFVDGTPHQTFVTTVPPTTPSPSAMPSPSPPLSKPRARAQSTTHFQHRSKPVAANASHRAIPPSPPPSPPLPADTSRRRFASQTTSDHADDDDDDSDREDGPHSDGYVQQLDDRVGRVVECALALVMGVIVGHWLRVRR